VHRKTCRARHKEKPKVIKRKILGIGLLFTPVLLFYGMAGKETTNIPYLDDYSCAIGFVTRWSQLGSFRERALALLTSQHNEYKPMFANAVYGTQYLVTGRINFTVLSTLGNLFLLPLLGLLYVMWVEDGRAISGKLILFIPVSWLIFQFQIYSLLSWPASTLQNIPVVVFSLATIYLLSKNHWRAFVFALMSLWLAIGSSGNGFFVVIVGCLMLLQFRRNAWLGYWLVASFGALALYLYHYNFMSSHVHSDHSVASSIYHLSPIYTLSLLGASIARYGNYAPAAVLGACLCLLLVYATIDRFYLTNPAIFYSTLFVMITALAVSGLRSDAGIAQSLVSRYRIYSNLAVVFAYLYGIGRMQGRFRGGRGSLAATAVIAIVSITFNVSSDRAGFKLLRTRTDLTREGLRRWEHGEQSITLAPGPANEDSVIRRQRLNGNFAPDDYSLRKAMALRIYFPPHLD
jgi:hypothetical protein